MDDYLSKPFEQRQLTTVLDRWLPASARSPAQIDRPMIDPPLDAALTPAASAA